MILIKLTDLIKYFFITYYFPSFFFIFYYQSHVDMYSETKGPLLETGHLRPSTDWCTSLLFY